MKKLFNIALTAIMMVAFSTAVQAQDNQVQNHEKQRMSREQLAEAQAKHIAKELALDDATSQKFVETFCEYQKEVWALSPRAKRPEMKDGKKPEMKDWKKAEKTDAEVEKAIQERFEHSQKILTIRENYYKKYRKFLSPKQVQRVYELEKKGMNRLRQGMKRGKMGMKPGKQGFKNGKPRMGKHNHSKKGNQQPAENSQP